MRRWAFIVTGIVVAVVIALVRTKTGPDEVAPSPTVPPPAAPTVAVAPGPIRFEDVSARSGVDFPYRNGEEAGLRAILESLGGGVALLDYDGDGRVDLFFPGGGWFERTGSGFKVRGHPDRLYRNLGDLRFEDVTRSAGLQAAEHYGHGAIVGDMDNDGDPDVVVSSYQGLTFYRNDGGKFVDFTEASGLGPSGWAAGLALADFDGDGRLDLYATRYVDWSPSHHPTCRYPASEHPDVCAPAAFSALEHALFHNRGDNRFVEVGRSRGLIGGAKGLGVVACDLDGDRAIDLYVANDTTPNLLYRNRGDGSFEESGLASGAALSIEGIATGSMGVDAGDVDGDGDLDLFVTNYEGETNELYRNDGGLTFVPVGMGLGLGAVSRPLVGWGTLLEDFDGDGRLDVVAVNGHLLHERPGQVQAQRPLLFHQDDRGRFADLKGAGGPYFDGIHQARGCAAGDLDDDGDLDLVIVHQNAPPAILRNDSPRGPALRLKLEGVKSNRSAIGATVVVEAGGRKLLRTIRGGGSYLSSNDLRLCVGLGAADRVDAVEVRWPSGATDRHPGPALDREWLLREGSPPVPTPRLR